MKNKEAYMAVIADYIKKSRKRQLDGALLKKRARSLKKKEPEKVAEET